LPEINTAFNSYKELVQGKVWIGSLGDTISLIEKEGCHVIVDLRSEKVLTGKEHPLHYVRIPLEQDGEHQQTIIQETVDWICELTEGGYRIGIHCSEERSRTGCIAIGTLIRLGGASTVQEAQATLQALWPDVRLRPQLLAALHDLYP